MTTQASSSEATDDSPDTAPESDRPSLSSRESSMSIHSLPPLPPLDFTSSQALSGRQRGMSFRTYLNWPIKGAVLLPLGREPTRPPANPQPLSHATTGVRPGLSVRVVRTEVVSLMPSVNDYIVHVVDLHTNVFWIAKKRFHDFYMLRKKVRAPSMTTMDEPLSLISHFPITVSGGTDSRRHQEDQDSRVRGAQVSP
jgi:hypothetical protein